ncbi:MAG: HmuY family protein [Archangium sp.]
MRASFLLCCLLVACAPRLEPKPFDAGVPRMTEGDGGIFTSQDPFDGGVRMTVDATGSSSWVYFDFDRAAEVGELEAGWDVAFQRFTIKSNCGISGDGGVEVARVETANLFDVTSEPPGPWMIDELDGDDEGSADDFAFVQNPAWYEYDVRYHTLTARPFVYVVRSTDKKLFRVKLRGYYDSVGTSGVMSLDWSPLP